VLAQHQGFLRFPAYSYPPAASRLGMNKKLEGDAVGRAEVNG